MSNSGKAPAPTSGGAMIEAIGLSKYYGPFAATQDVTFSVPRRQVAAFLGPNGAGKSTTMKLLTGFLAPSAGTARIGGYDVSTNRIEASRSPGHSPASSGATSPSTTGGSALTVLSAASRAARAARHPRSATAMSPPPARPRRRR